MSMKMQIKYALPILIFCMYKGDPADAAVEKTAAAKFHGTLIVVECSINSGQRQTVDFGDAVGIYHIDGKHYEQPVPFSIDCKNYAGGEMPAMTLTAEGTVTSFNESALATNVNGLGIELRSNGKALSLNKAVDLDYDHLPSLSAVPVADPSVELQEQPFSATVRLTVEVP